MKLASFQYQGQALYGRVDDAGVHVPPAAILERYPTLAAVLAADAVAELAGAGAAVLATAAIEFAPVIPQPGKIICVGINFVAHMNEMGREPPEYPWLFVRFPDSLVGHEQPLLRPRSSGDYDYEGEFAFVIGRTAHHVAAAHAFDYVAGYTCLMDGSLRDYQRHGSQFTPGKNFYRSGSCGPWLVTTDEIPDPRALQLETRLNGQVMQQAPLSDLKFDIPALLEYCSSFCRLEPGDIISTGTPGGVGFARKPPVWLQPGDTLEVEIDQIGVLRNGVIAE